MPESRWPHRMRVVIEAARDFVTAAAEFPPEAVSEARYWTGCEESLKRLLTTLDAALIPAALPPVGAPSPEVIADLGRGWEEAVATGRVPAPVPGRKIDGG